MQIKRTILYSGLASFFILVIATYVYFNRDKFKFDEVKTQQVVEGEAENNSVEGDKKNEKEKNQPADIVTGNFEKVQIDEALLAKNFSNALSDAGKCLNIPSLVGAENLEPNSENLAAALRPDLGEVVMKNEEKVESYFNVGKSEKRKIRLEMDYSGEASVVRRLSYSIQPEGATAWMEQELTSEQSEDPSESFIASLMNDGDLYYEEKLAKLYFQNGEDISYFSSDGRILSFEFYHEGKKFTCKQLQIAATNCVCQ